MNKEDIGDLCNFEKSSPSPPILAANGNPGNNVFIRHTCIFLPKLKLTTLMRGFGVNKCGGKTEKLGFENTGTMRYK